MEEEQGGEDRDKEMQEEEREGEENATVDLNLEAKDNEKAKVPETVRVLTLEVTYFADSCSEDESDGEEEKARRSKLTGRN